MIRNATIFCKHFRFFAFNWNAMLNCIFDIHATIAFHNFEFIHSMRWRRFAITKIHCIRCDDDNSQRRFRDFLSFWNKKKSVNFDDIFQKNSVNVFATMISNYETYIFFLFLRNRSFFRKFASLFDLKQRFLNDFDKKIRLTRKNNNILML